MFIYTIEYFPSEEKNKLVEELKKKLLNLGGKESVEKDKAEYIFIVGGDGTFFHFCKKYAFSNKRLVGIQSGNTAFSLNFNSKELDADSFVKWKPIHLLKISLGGVENYAVNDIYIDGDPFLEADIYVKKNFLEKFRGSGIILSSQYGSTGMNKSLGGPILLTQKDLWIMNGIAPCNTRKCNSISSPVVLSSKNDLKIEILSKKEHKVYIDGNKVDSDVSFNSLEVSLIKGEAKVLEMKLDRYINRIREIFLI